MTPQGSATSIQFGVGLTDAPVGSTRGLYLVVPDIEACHRELTDRGVAVSDAMTPLFTQIPGHPQAMREWFAQLVLYSMTAAMSHTYVDFFTLGHAVLRMLADIHGVRITDEDLYRVRHGISTMPTHPDVAGALDKLRDNGFRLVTLTNSPPNPYGQSSLEHAGLGGLFERQSASIPADL